MYACAVIPVCHWEILHRVGSATGERLGVILSVAPRCPKGNTAPSSAF